MLKNYVFFKIIEPMGFAEGLDVKCMRKKGVKDNSEDSFLSN